MSSIDSRTPLARPGFRSLADIRRLEQGRYEDVVPFQSTGELLQYAARTYGAATAIRFQETANPDDAPLTWSFEELWLNVCKAAALFRSLGIQRDEAVALLVPHIPSAHFALWGAQLAGCVFPINFLLGADHIAELLKTTNTKVVVTLAHADALPINAEVRKAVAQAGCVQHMLELDPNERHPAAASFQQQMHVQDASEDFLAELNADSLAALFHTGGTTGLPKILRHSHRNEVHTSWFGAMYYAMQPGDIVLNGFPLFHVAGTFVYGLAAFATGVSLYMPTLTGMRNQEFVKRAWTFMQRNRVTHLGCVPTILSALLGVPRKDDEGETVRVALTGGSPLPNELAARFEEVHRIPVRNIFGMTECAGLVAIEPTHGARHPGSVGIRLPYSEVAAVPLEHASDDTLNTFCPPGQVGIIALRGPHVSTGYLDPSRNRGIFTQDRWLLSGDLGYLDENGYIYLTGRAKDLIIRGGHNIEPGMIEEAFLKHPAVSTCAAVGEPDGYAGELPVAFVTLKEDARIDTAALLAEVASFIPERPALPKRVLVLDRLPTTPVGKVYKPTLRAMAAQEKVGEVLQSLKLTGALQVEGRAETSGTAVTIRGTRALSEAELASLKQALLGLPVRIHLD